MNHRSLVGGTRLTRRAIEQVAENRISEAMEHGEFDHLSGLGEPIVDLDGNYDPDWWLKAWLRRNLDMMRGHEADPS